MKITRMWVVAGCLLLTVLASLAQQRNALTNQDVIGMVNAGLDDPTILKAIQANPQDFDLSVPGLIALKSGNVSGAVLRAMIDKARAGTANAAPKAPDVPAAPAADVPTTTWRGPPVFQPFPVDFSAESFAAIGGKAAVSEGKLFVGNGRLRLETTGAHSKTTIVDPLKPVACLRSPGTSAWICTAFQGVRGSPSMTPGISMYLLPVDPQNPCQNWNTVECTAMGTDIIDGRTTTKWDLTHHFEDATWHSTIWVDVRLHVVSKRKYKENEFEMRNIVEVPQPANLFEMQ